MISPDIINAVVILLVRYRQALGLKESDVLSNEQVEEIIEGVRFTIYKHEGIYKKKS